MQFGAHECGIDPSCLKRTTPPSVVTHTFVVNTSRISDILARVAFFIPTFGPSLSNTDFAFFKSEPKGESFISSMASIIPTIESMTFTDSKLIE